MVLRAISSRLTIIAAIAGCGFRSGGEQPIAEAERAALADSAVAVMQDAFDDVHRKDAAAILARYVATPEVTHVEDTVVTSGPEAIQRSFAAAISATAAIDSGRLTEPRTIVIDRRTVVVISPFQEIITLPDKKRYLDRGVWSSVVVRQAEGWRLLTGHVSHASVGLVER